MDLSSDRGLMPMITGRSYLGTSSRFDRPQVMSERTYYFACAHMTATHQMLVP